MAVRESRRPGEGLFDFLDRTTRPASAMRVINGGGRGDCAYPGQPFSHTTYPLIGKEQQ